MKASNKKDPFLFKILWSKTFIGIAVNEQEEENWTTPLTRFYFWPQADGWKLLKFELDTKPWMTESAKTEILNKYTLLIHFWLENVHRRLDLPGQLKKDLNLNVDVLGGMKLD